MVIFAFVRIGTHPRAFANPMSIELAAGHVDSWLNCRICRFVPMEAVDVRESLSLLTAAGVGADLTTDSQIAAIALRLDATIHSADTDFLRFPGIRVFNPLVKSG
jgi:predicted nucleic acid-binding protein